MSLPMPPTPPSVWLPRRASPSRSSASPPVRSASPFTQGAGWLKGASRGSAETAVSPETSRPPSPRLPPSSTPPPSCSSPGGSLVPHEFRDRLSELPFWPRCLSREEAARYVGVSVAVFEAEVRNGIWPLGRARGAKGGRLTWDRLALDAAEDRRSGLAAEPSVSLAPDPDVLAWETRLNAANHDDRSQRRLVSAR
ncbi:protein of unknown function [Rhodovastum atsumiense]|nr:protein of unknown function [Rhodovastum atsumiense]